VVPEHPQHVEQADDATSSRSSAARHPAARAPENKLRSLSLEHGDAKQLLSSSSSSDEEDKAEEEDDDEEATP